MYTDFLGGSDGKASAYNEGDQGSIPGSGRSPGEGNGNPLQYSCLEKSHGWRSLVGYSPQGHKESDTTERLHFTSLHFLRFSNCVILDVLYINYSPFRTLFFFFFWQGICLWKY